jgi:hypothetical protein
MSKRFYDMAKKNYPALWNREMVDHFHEIGRLTDEEYIDIVGEEFEEITGEPYDE